MKSKRKNKNRRTKRGGSKYYYDYNRFPRIFTNTTSKLFGNLKGGDARTTLLPQPLANVFQGMSDSNTSNSNTWNGYYQTMSSSVLKQPIDL